MNSEMQITDCHMAMKCSILGIPPETRAVFNTWHLAHWLNNANKNGEHI